MGGLCSHRRDASQSQTSEAPVSLLMKEMGDRNKSGGIDAEEFRKLVTPSGSWSEATADRIFQSADKNGDGELSSEEIANAFSIGSAWPGLQNVLESGAWSSTDIQKFVRMADIDGDGTVSEMECKRLHEHLDRNADGRVSEAELQAGVGLAEQHLYSAKSLLHAADTNADGKISWEEASDLQGLSAKDIHTFMQDADTNGDGSVSLQEMQAFIAKWDKNGDGKLSPQEWREALQKNCPVSSMVLCSLQKHLIDPRAKRFIDHPMKEVLYRSFMAGARSKLTGGTFLGAVANEAMSTAGWKALEFGASKFLQSTGGAATAHAPQAALGPDPARTCLLCLRTDAEVVYRPCRHRNVCRQCYGQQISSNVLRCPTCGGRIEL